MFGKLVGPLLSSRVRENIVYHRYTFTQDNTKLIIYTYMFMLDHLKTIKVIDSVSSSDLSSLHGEVHPSLLPTCLGGSQVEQVSFILLRKYVSWSQIISAE